MLKNESVKIKAMLWLALFVGLSGVLVACYVSWRDYNEAQMQVIVEAKSAAQLFKQALLQPLRNNDAAQMQHLVSAPFSSKPPQADDELSEGRHYELNKMVLLSDTGAVLASSHPNKIPLASNYVDPEITAFLPRIAALKDNSAAVIEMDEDRDLYVLMPIGENGVKYANLVIEYSMRQLLDSTLVRIKELAFIIAFISGMLMVLAWFAAARFTRPLIRLVNDIQQLASRHGYHLAQHAAQRDEVVHLTQVFGDLNYALDLAEYERDYFQQRARMALAGLENSAQGILITDVNLAILLSNDATHRLTGYASSETSSMNLMKLCLGESELNFEQEVLSAIKQGGHWDGELVGKRRDGSRYPAWLSIAAMQDSSVGNARYVCILSDISERKIHEEKMRYQAQHDALTGLPNRVLLQDRLEQSIARAARINEQFSVMFLDLDHFKRVNDLLGHDVGDMLLKQVSQRLVDTVRACDTVCRLGGDEFVLLIAPIHHDNEAEAVAAKIIQTLSAPYYLDDGRELHTSVSIGVSVYPADGLTPDDLTKSADMAMYQAKAEGRNNFQRFTTDMHGEMFARVTLESQLRTAIQQQQFVLHYQPQIDLVSGHIAGLEALIRWNHPEKGMVYPDDFIAQAEESSLIVEIGEWVLNEACKQIRAWKNQGMEVPTVGVNVSFRQFHQHDLQATVEEALHRHHLTGDCLELELTESVMLRDPEKVLSVLRELRKQGIRISIDDFGNGYSSLRYLQRLDVDTLKIDRSFVIDMHQPQGEAIVETIISIAKNLSLHTVAEGVETEVQRAKLHAMNCNEMQGYFFSKPLCADEAQALIRQHSSPRPATPRKRRPLAA